MDKQRLHAIIEGRVQGVGFRYFVIENAHRLKLSGWVRNCIDGSVEITAEGNQLDLEDLLLSVQKGPSSSLVTKVRNEWSPAENTFTLFTLRPTNHD